MSYEEKIFKFPTKSAETETSLDSLVAQEKTLNERLMLGNYPDKSHYFECRKKISDLTSNEGDALHGDYTETSAGFMAIKNIMSEMEGTEYWKALAKLESIKTLRAKAQENKRAEEKELPQAA